MNYPLSFVIFLKTNFPNNTLLHELADTNQYSLGKEIYELAKSTTGEQKQNLLLLFLLLFRHSICLG